MPEPNSVCNQLRFKKKKQQQTHAVLQTCQSSMLMALSSCTRRVSRCMDWLSGLFRLMAVLWLWWRWIWLRCIRRLSQSLRNSALRVYWRQNLKAAIKRQRQVIYQSELDGTWYLGGWDVKTSETLCHLAGQCHGTGAPPWSCFLADPGTDGKIPTRTSPMEWGAVGQYDPGCLLHSQHSGAHWNNFHGEKKDTWISI